MRGRECEKGGCESVDDGPVMEGWKGCGEKVGKERLCGKGVWGGRRQSLRLVNGLVRVPWED